MPHKNPAPGFVVIVYLASVLAVVSLGARLVFQPSELAAQSSQPAAAPPSTPQEQRPPVFRAGTTFVSVDVYPRRRGTIVEGLHAQDFQVFEDGKPQPVETFEFVRIAPKAGDDDGRDPTSVSDMNRQAANPRNRLFVVYLDIHHTRMFDSVATRLPLLDFLGHALGPTDLFAVMSPDLPISALTFARRTDTLRAELAKYGDWGLQGDSRASMPRTPLEERLYQCSGDALLNAHRQDMFYSSLEALVVHLGGIREERKNILMLTGSWMVPTARPSLAVGGSRPPSIPTVGVGRGGTMRIGGAQERTGQPDVTFCEAAAMRLESIDYESRFRELLHLAQQSNVSFYPVDTAGLRVGRFSELNTLLTLAENTGGSAIVNTNDIAGSLRKMTEELSAFYLIGYYSSNQAADGRYRRIEVKVKQPGVQVSARRGYLGWTAEMRRAEAEVAARARSSPSAVDMELARLSRVRDTARVNAYAVASAAGIDVVAEIAGREIEAGRWTKGAIASVTLAGPEGASARASAQIQPGTRSTLIRVPMASLAAGAWRAALALQGDEERVEEDVAVSATGPSSLVGAPLVFRGAPSPRAPWQPVADFTFRRVERLHIEWEVRGAIDQMSARLLNRRGEPMALPVALAERETDGRKVMAADLLLSPLPDGEFVVEVSLRGGASERALLAFRVVR
jgi:VWFA-related protein